VRASLVRALELGDLDRELFLVGPLLDRFDPAEVAAAALRLAAEAAPLAAPAPAPEGPVWAKLYVSVGKRDSVRPADLVGAITGEAGVPASHIGRIECREQFSLVEIRAEDATRAVRELTGATVRGRRLTVRIDRGPGPGPRPVRRS
jgi:ATP-dependent RNA helicase DeaD